MSRGRAAGAAPITAAKAAPVSRGALDLTDLLADLVAVWGLIALF